MSNQGTINPAALGNVSERTDLISVAYGEDWTAYLCSDGDVPNFWYSLLSRIQRKYGYLETNIEEILDIVNAVAYVAVFPEHIHMVHRGAEGFIFPNKEKTE